MHGTDILRPHPTDESENTIKLLRSTDDMKFKAMNSDTLRHGIPPQSPWFLLRARSTAPIHGTASVRPHPTDEHGKDVQMTAQIDAFEREFREQSGHGMKTLRSSFVEPCFKLTDSSENHDLI